MTKAHEFRFDVRVFARAKDKATAEAFATKLNDLLKQELTSDFLKWRVSFTGSSVNQVEDLEQDKGKAIVKAA